METDGFDGELADEVTTETEKAPMDIIPQNPYILKLFSTLSKARQIRFYDFLVTLCREELLSDENSAV